MYYKLYQGDCLKIMENIPDKSIDLVICDLPYGITDCKWDTTIPFEPLWRQYKRILKNFGVCVLFGNQPFTSMLINSNLKEYSHIWYWKKQYTTGYLLTKKQPLRCVEDIVVFNCNSLAKNNKGMHESLRKYFYEQLRRSKLARKDINKILGNQMSSHYFTNGEQFSIPNRANYEKLQQQTGCFSRDYTSVLEEYNQETLNNRSDITFTYNPQGVEKCYKPYNSKSPISSIYDNAIKKQGYVQTVTNYPKNLLEIDGIVNGQNRLHPPKNLLNFLNIW